MRRLIALFLLLALAAIALLALRDPGHASLSWGGWQVQTTLAVLLGLALAVVLLLWLILRLLGLILRTPSLLRQRQARRKQERALRELAAAVFSLIEGDWMDAERRFKRHAEDARDGILWLLGQAFTAHRQGAPARRDDALRLAEQRYPEASRVLRLFQAELLLDDDRPQEALGRLEPLHAENPRHAQVLRLMMQAHRRLQQWQAVLDDLAKLQRLRALPEEEGLALEEEAIEGRLVQLTEQGAEAVDAFWNGLRRSLRGRERLRLAHARALAAAGQAQGACDLLFRMLREYPSVAAARLLAGLDVPEPKTALEAAESLLARHGAEARIAAPLHLFAARMAWKLDLWGKARSHAEAALALAPSAEAHALLARALERQGLVQQALEQAWAALDLKPSP